MSQYDPYEGTTIGADGNRYASDSPDIPTSAPARRGKFVTEAAFAETRDRVLGLSDNFDRTITDGVLVESDATFESNAANFTSDDVGAEVDMPGVPEGTTIVSVTDENTVELSNEATESATGVDATITQDAGEILENLGDQADESTADIDAIQDDLDRTVTDGITLLTDATFESNQANFTAADVNASISGTGIPAGTKILSVTDENTVEMTANATAAGTGLTVTIVRDAGVVLAQTA